MDYTEAMLWCLRKLSEQRFELLKKHIEKEFAGTEVFEYLMRILGKVDRIT